MFDISLWPRDERDQLIVHGSDELQQLIQHFSIPLMNNDFDTVNREYKELKFKMTNTDEQLNVMNCQRINNHESWFAIWASGHRSSLAQKGKYSVKFFRQVLSEVNFQPWCDYIYIMF